MDHGTILTRIVATPGTCGGVPRLDGTRIPARLIVEELRGGTPEPEIMEAYPSLPPDGIDAVRLWAHENGISVDPGAQGGFEAEDADNDADIL